MDMSWLFEQPGVVIVLVTAAAVLVLIEVALPTLGIAGTTAAVCVLGVISAIVKQDGEWWPLSLCAVAVASWAVLVVTQHRHAGLELGAAGVYLAGGLGFAVANDSWASAVVAVVATGVLALGYPPAHAAALRVMNKPATAGMESHLGRIATVARWDGAAGTVLLDGSRWNAVAPPGARFRVGEQVRVSGYRGSTFQIDVLTGSSDATNQPRLVAPPLP